MQPSPYANRVQYSVSLPVKGRAANKSSKLPLLPHLPAFTVLPADASVFNRRALSQSTRYIAAQSKAQVTEDVVRGDVQQVRDLRFIQAGDGFESRLITKEQDLDAAEILVTAAKEQHPICKATDTGTTSVDTDGEIEFDATMEYLQRPICECHHKGFPLRAERDKHTSTPIENDIECGSYWCSTVLNLNRIQG